jgi:hypothetical protein
VEIFIEGVAGNHGGESCRGVASGDAFQGVGVGWVSHGGRGSSDGVARASSV